MKEMESGKNEEGGGSGKEGGEEDYTMVDNPPPVDVRGTGQLSDQRDKSGSERVWAEIL